MKKMSGGLAGDLMRLYPIQSESMFPHKVTYICLCIEYSPFCPTRNGTVPGCTCFTIFNP